MGAGCRNKAAPSCSPPTFDCAILLYVASLSLRRRLCGVHTLAPQAHTPVPRAGYSQRPRAGPSHERAPSKLLKDTHVLLTWRLSSVTCIIDTLDCRHLPPCRVSSPTWSIQTSSRGRCSSWSGPRGRCHSARRHAPPRPSLVPHTILPLGPLPFARPLAAHGPPRPPCLMPSPYAGRWAHPGSHGRGGGARRVLRCAWRPACWPPATLETTARGQWRSTRPALTAARRSTHPSGGCHGTGGGREARAGCGGGGGQAPAEAGDEGLSVAAQAVRPRVNLRVRLVVCDHSTVLVSRGMAGSLFASSLLCAPPTPKRLEKYRPSGCAQHSAHRLTSVCGTPTSSLVW